MLRSNELYLESQRWDVRLSHTDSYILSTDYNMDSCPLLFISASADAKFWKRKVQGIMMVTTTVKQGAKSSYSTYLMPVILYCLLVNHVYRFTAWSWISGFCSTEYLLTVTVRSSSHIRVSSIKCLLFIFKVESLKMFIENCYKLMFRHQIDVGVLVKCVAAEAQHHNANCASRPVPVLLSDCSR